MGGGGRKAGRWAVLALAAALGVRRGFAEPTVGLRQGPDDPLAYAADGTWPMEDGCPARTRATRTSATLGPTEVMWTYEAPSPIAGDPLVCGDRVVVASAIPSGGAILDVLRLLDGTPIVSRKVFSDGTRLQPLLWKDYIVVAAAEGALEVLRIMPAAHALALVDRFSGRPGGFVVDGDLVFVGSSNGIERRFLEGSGNRWFSPTQGAIQGPISARDGIVAVVTTQAREGFKGREASVETFDLARGGRAGGPLTLGWEDDEGTPGPSRVVLGRDEWFVIHPCGFRMKSGTPATGARVPVVGGRGGTPFFLRYRGVPAVWGGDAFVGYDDPDEGALLVKSRPKGDPKELADGSWTFRRLAAASRSEEFLRTGPPSVVAGGVVVTSVGEFQVETGRVESLLASPRDNVVIPARDTMLEVRGKTTLVARRRRRPAAASSGPSLGGDPTQPMVAVADAVVVTSDGVVRRGDATLTPADGRLAVGKATVSLADVVLVVDRDGKIVHAPDPTSAPRWLPAVVEERTRDEWLGLAKKALSTHDASTIRRAIEDLYPRAGRVADLAPFQKELDRLANPGPWAGPKRDRAQVVEIEKRRAELLPAETRAFEAALASLPAAATVDQRAPLIRAVIGREPTFAGATEWLKARFPPGFAPGPEAGPLELLDLLEAVSQTPVEILPKKEKGEMALDDRTYAAARLSWRPDLVAVRSTRLLLLTPVSQPGRIARALSLCELLCSALDDVFGLRGATVKSADPLVLHLYESRAEYEARSPVGLRDEAGREFVQWTMGHYDPQDGVSRVFLPAPDEISADVIRTLSHELAHNWMDQRMPPPPGIRRATGGKAIPNYFLEEGFATLAEEIAYDVEGRTWRTLDRGADSLDTVANSPVLLDWDELVERDYDTFLKIPRVFDVPVSSSWTLSEKRMLSRMNLFYSQAAAICHYRYEANDGAKRTALLDWIRYFHSDRVSAGETLRRTGMTPQALGSAVVAWAKEVTSRRD